MIMANLADVCNDKNKIAYAFDDAIKEFCTKYQISPWDIRIEYTGTGLIIKVIV